MFRKAISFGGLLLLAGAAVLVTPSFSQAQHRGGGGHFGGTHVSGAHFSGAHFGGAHTGGYHSGFYNGGSHYGQHLGSHYGYGTWSYPRYNGYRYPRYYGSYSAGPYSYGYYPYSYAAPSYDWPSQAYDSGDYGSYGGATSSSPDSYSPPSAQPDTSAQVTVSVPADAEVWFNGTKTTSTGAAREYQSPPLAPGTRYTYELRARWSQNGQDVTQTQQVEVSAGSRVNVHFPVQETTAPTAPSR